MGPIIVVWIVAMGVLVIQHDLGTSLMFFAMFVQSFAHGRLFVGIQSIQFFKQCQALAFDKSRHIQRSLC